jgi:formate hydrogenlyase subunit 3/multisubunit Na+/H+ antiporter MnhD subunit
MLDALPSPLSACLWGVAILFALGLPGVALARTKAGGSIVYLLCFAIATVLFAYGASRLLHAAEPETLKLPLGVPWMRASFRLDALSAVFLCIINVSAAGASFFAAGYGRHERAPARVVPFFPVFVAGMNLVVLADDAFTFLLAWEAMSLSSWALVLSHHREAGNARAGYVYLVMASLGAAALLLDFGLLAGSAGAYDFAAIRQAHFSPFAAGAAFALALFGAGSKAGLAPLHVWLPLAHPAAPSHVSALMSGAMTKVAVYGFIRIALDLIGAPSWWWGLAVLVIGGVTAALGVLFALIQTDLKRVLAYSTIENIGFVFVGLGLAVAFQTNNMPAPAALAFTAAVFHAANHSVFKTLLFCGSGAVLNATETQDMDKLGGLIRRMPQTSAAFLLGCIAISALPPLNGFASEWLTLQAILLSPQLPQWPLKVMVPGVGGLLALAAALAGACFVRAFGVAFLGRPRTVAAAEAHEVDLLSRTAMIGLAAICVLAGVFPGFIIDALSGAAQLAVGAHMAPQAEHMSLTLIPVAESRSSYNAMFVFAFLVASMAITAQVIHRFASLSVHRTPAWDCGYPDPSPATQYTAGSFSQPIRRVFSASVFRASETVQMPPPGSTAPARFRLDVRDRIWDGLYAPVAALIQAAADRLNHFQFLTIRRYLGFVFGSLILLLLVIALWP